MVWGWERGKQCLREELESHLRMAIAERIARGEDPEQARAEALREFGNLPLIEEVTRARWGWLWLEHLVRDLRFALSQLGRSPAFTITAVLTLALGIGAFTTVTTWTNAILYNPWPRVIAPREVRFIDATVLGNSGYSVHYDNYELLRESGRSWSEAIAFSMTEINLIEHGGQPRAVTAGLVSSNYFHFLGLTPQSGRFFPPDDDRAYGKYDEVVLSDALWRDGFNADSAILGRAISINHHQFTVVGVAPREFAGIFGGVAETAWIPLSGLRDLSADSPPDPLLQWHYGLQVAVRLRPGVGDAAAAAEVHALARAFVLKSGGNQGHWDLNLRDAAHFERGLFIIIGSQLPVLLGASVLLMVLVCINIASLLGQHAARRRREVAIRAALGATPARIASQVLAETGVLAAAGAAAGWAASIGMARGLYVLLPNFGVPLAFNLHSDGRILIFVASVAVTVTLACGIYPVRQSLRVSQNEALHEGGAAVAGNPRKRLGRRILLGLQLGICFIVLVCCGLLTRSALNISHRTVGFDRTNCLTAELDLGRAGYPTARGLAMQTALLDRLRSAPGLASATLTSHPPLGDDNSGNTLDIAVPGYVPAKGEEMSVITDYEGPDFFHMMGIAMRQGRDFTTADTASSAPVAIVNQFMARRYWPNTDAIGHSIVVGGHSCRIVGIIGDFAYSNPANTDPESLLFLPLTQHYSSTIFVALRPRGSIAEAAALLRQTVGSLDPSLPIEDVRTLEAVTAERYQMSRIPAELLSVYALSSVLVAMLGLYAVMAYSVIERHREFALRIALGSTRLAVFRLVLSGSAWTAGLGLLAGGLGSIGAVRLLRSMLFGVEPFDLSSYCAAGALLILTVFLSGLVPARRAASVEPMQALHTE